MGEAGFQWINGTRFPPEDIPVLMHAAAGTAQLALSIRNFSYSPQEKSRPLQYLCDIIAHDATEGKKHCTYTGPDISVLKWKPDYLLHRNQTSAAFWQFMIRIYISSLVRIETLQNQCITSKVHMEKCVVWSRSPFSISVCHELTTHDPPLDATIFAGTRTTRLECHMQTKP